MSRFSRVRTVRPRTIGSRSSWLEEKQWPGWLYYGSRGVAWTFRNWRWTGPIALLGFLWSSAGLLLTVLFVGVSGIGCLTAWLVWQGRRDEVPASGARLNGLSWQDIQLRHKLRKQWGLACRAGKLLGAESGEPPALTRLSGTGSGTLEATVKCGEVGVPVSSFQKQTDVLSDVIGCREVVVTPQGSGVAKLTFHWRDPIGRALPLAALPIAGTAGQLAYGIRQDGTVATIRATQSVLIGGLTRMGKSNLVWALLADALRQGIPIDLYVSDPKGGVELDQLEEAVGRENGLLRVRQYAKTPAETVKMIEAAEKALHARQYWMKQNGARKITPDAVNPLVVIILDETLPLTDLLKKGTDSPLGRVAYTGAAAAYVVWANTQVAQVDSIGRFRDLVPQRICFATPNAQVTDSVLGQGSETMGAGCSNIREAGRGYSHSEGDKLARKFRAAMITDAETRLIARGQLPAQVVNAAQEAYDRRAEETQAGRSRRTALYRWFYVDSREYGNSLGYVGISYDVVQREAQHSAALRAFMEGNVRREVVYYATRGEAEAAEKLAIEVEKPIHNVVYAGAGRRLRGRGKRDKVA